MMADLPLWEATLNWVARLLAIGDAALEVMSFPGLDLVADAVITELTGHSLASWRTKGTARMLAQLAASAATGSLLEQLNAVRNRPSVRRALVEARPKQPTTLELIMQARIPDDQTVLEWARDMSDALGIPAAQVIAIRRRGRSTLRGR